MTPSHIKWKLPSIMAAKYASQHYTLSRNRWSTLEAADGSSASTSYKKDANILILSNFLRRWVPPLLLLAPSTVLEHNLNYTTTSPTAYKVRHLSADFGFRVPYSLTTTTTASERNGCWSLPPINSGPDFKNHGKKLRILHILLLLCSYRAFRWRFVQSLNR